MVGLISSSVSESSEDVASSNTSNCGFRSNARAIESRCFSPPDTLTPPSPITVSSPRSARARSLSTEAWRSTSMHSSSVASGLYEQQVLADGAGEKLRILRDEADPFAQAVDVDLVLAGPVVVNVPGLRP